MASRLSRAFLVLSALGLVSVIGWQSWRMRQQSEQLRGLQAQMETDRALGVAEVAATPPARKIESVVAPNSPALSGLAQTSVTLQPGPLVPAPTETTIVHAPETKIVLEPGVTVTSVEGGMVTDADQRLISGNLIVETKGIVMHAQGALMDAETRAVVAKEITIVAPEVPAANPGK